MYDSVRSVFKAFSTTFEGEVPYMYLDIKKLVTVGIGNLIDPIGLAMGLPFVHKSDTDSAASADEITAEWNTVKGDTDLAAGGHLMADKVTHLMLTQSAIDDLVAGKADQFMTTLAQTTEFADVESWPADAQLGLLSMAWAMGPAFGSKFPSFRAACGSADWNAAAQNCHMQDEGNGGLAPRNAADAALFQSAAYGVAQGTDAATLLYVPSGSRPALKAGVTGDHVTYLQDRLVTLGYLSSSTGTFDDDTVAAVTAFQTQQELTADGVVGNASWAALGTAVPEQ